MIDNMNIYDYYLMVVGINPNTITEIINQTTIRI